MVDKGFRDSRRGKAMFDIPLKEPVAVLSLGNIMKGFKIVG